MIALDRVDKKIILIDAGNREKYLNMCEKVNFLIYITAVEILK